MLQRQSRILGDYLVPHKISRSNSSLVKNCRLVNSWFMIKIFDHFHIWTSLPFYFEWFHFMNRFYRFHFWISLDFIYQSHWILFWISLDFIFESFFSISFFCELFYRFRTLNLLTNSLYSSKAKKTISMIIFQYHWIFLHSSLIFLRLRKMSSNRSDPVSGKLFQLLPYFSAY